MTSIAFIIGILAYGFLGRVALALPARVRMIAFAALNVATAGALFYRKSPWPWMLLVYLAVVVVHHALVRCFASAQSRFAFIPFWFPLVVLVFAKCNLVHGSALFFIGVSYMTFRLSYLALEVRNGTAPMPRLEEQIAFAFFVPVMPMGPITNYQTFDASVRAGERLDIGTSLLRIVVGFCKYLFIGELFNSIAFDGLLNDGGQKHGRIDYLVAAVCYHLYLYCNFSGFCDVAIGVAGLMNIRVQENFDRPFVSRNVKEYWNRWHITLSHYMRDVVFAPLSKLLVRLFGPRRVNHAIAVSIAVVFLLVGIWHGVGWNFLAYGAFHALAVVANHYYTIALKSALGAKGFRSYMASRVVHAVAVVGTFLYVSLCMTVFARTDWWALMKHIFA